ncbi:MAG TPA: DNA polymerase IV [Gammaproteobacteria bacterium]|nr:DNA polymerase IV [Gammaproteobacteria bacterium]
MADSVDDIARGPLRKIIHIDMDAFYASVAQRDDPALRGRPVIVAWRSPRSVVCAASYEARRYGVRSAMPASRAARLCPDGVFVAPDFPRYRAVSAQVRDIFRRYTDLIEPLSLDEAYLDVTHNKPGLPTATAVARAIRSDIFAATALTASAGVAPNKYLAKIASDWRKPNGLFVIQPAEVDAFVADLPVSRLPGVGRATEEQLAALGVKTVAELRALERPLLVARFGRYGQRLYDLARGIDDRAVVADRPVQSISAEQTFEHDLPPALVEAALPALAEQVWRAAARAGRVGRTVVLKLKTADFRVLSRHVTPPQRPRGAEDILAFGRQLLARMPQDATRRYRLAGLGLANFVDVDDARQPALFDGVEETGADFAAGASSAIDDAS